jgi:hypothetical protein
MGAADYLVWYQIRQEGTGTSVRNNGQWMARGVRGREIPVVMPPKTVSQGTTDYYVAFVENVREALRSSGGGAK